MIHSSQVSRPTGRSSESGNKSTVRVRAQAYEDLTLENVEVREDEQVGMGKVRATLST